jgi:hypothetical protein
MRNQRARRSGLTRDFSRRLRRLMTGVPVAGLVMQLRPTDLTCQRWRVAVFEPTDRHSEPHVVAFEGRPHQLREVFEGSLNGARRIACASYPSASRHFGPARAYVRHR